VRESRRSHVTEQETPEGGGRAPRPTSDTDRGNGNNQAVGHAEHQRVKPVVHRNNLSVTHSWRMFAIAIFASNSVLGLTRPGLPRLLRAAPIRRAYLPAMGLVDMVSKFVGNGGEPKVGAVAPLASDTAPSWNELHGMWSSQASEYERSFRERLAAGTGDEACSLATFRLFDGTKEDAERVIFYRDTVRVRVNAMAPTEWPRGRSARTAATSVGSRTRACVSFDAGHERLSATVFCAGVVAMGDAHGLLSRPTLLADPPPRSPRRPRGAPTAKRSGSHWRRSACPTRSRRCANTAIVIFCFF